MIHDAYKIHKGVSSCILHPVSCILYPASCILYLLTFFLFNLQELQLDRR